MPVQNNLALDHNGFFEDFIFEPDPVIRMINNNLDNLDLQEKALLKVLLDKVEHRPLQEAVISQILSSNENDDVFTLFALIIHGLNIGNSSEELTKTYVRCLAQQCLKINDLEIDYDNKLEKIKLYMNCWRQFSRLFPDCGEL